MRQELSCPLGSECEGIKDNRAFRCAWHTKLVGKNPNDGTDMDQWGCAIAWLPVLLIENAQTNRGQTAAIESFRNEMVRGQDAATQVLSLIGNN